ncbi:tyrosine/phenylalanine carboxypeptidase domain-containing protein [Methanosarcina siciliae]|uniref:tyrosine/phenylalanine carboxypeptidase domain-containing protein n=1 Tax=Methanosarcina siciliae TaxID=38027 RepID=UPI000A5D787A|nr:tyrosine/phenylalanine carboxypeptidase domain-containing protein [Methanosarcina siciliae]
MNSEKCILQYDHIFWDLDRRIDIFRYINPINGVEEKRKFLTEYELGNCYNPQFEYEEFDPNIGQLYKELLSVRTKFETCKNSLLAPYYLKNIDDLVFRIDLFSDRKNPDFGDKLSNLYGKPTSDLIKEAGKNLETLKYAQSSEENLTPNDVYEIFKTEMGNYGFNWDIKIYSRASAKLSVNASLNEIKINASEKFSEMNIRRYIYHEIKTHVFRAENGKLQPFMIFKNGFPDYITTEEGLALFNENKHGLLSSEDVKRYSARAIAADYSTKSSFYEIFEKLVKHFPPSTAYSIVQRVKRGMLDTSLPGGYTKDMVYMDGFQKVSSFLKNNDSMEILYTGKIGLDNVDLAQELIDRGILSRPKYMP